MPEHIIKIIGYFYQNIEVISVEDFASFQLGAKIQSDLSRLFKTLNQILKT